MVYRLRCLYFQLLSIYSIKKDVWHIHINCIKKYHWWCTDYTSANVWDKNANSCCIVYII